MLGVRFMDITDPAAWKNLVVMFQSIVDERRRQRDKDFSHKRRDMMDTDLEVEDENGHRLDDEEIIDLLLMYINVGHESSRHITMWTTIFLQEHAEFLEKARAELEEILRRRPQSQQEMTLNKYRQMHYLSRVINETLRLITFSLAVFREAKTDVTISYYIIPEGWRMLVWLRSFHLNPEYYSKPKKFDPSRWDNFIPKAGTFMPFGLGSRLFPGNELAMLEAAMYRNRMGGVLGVTRRPSIVYAHRNEDIVNGGHGLRFSKATVHHGDTRPQIPDAFKRRDIP
ncbi:hypothetical protein MLD38_021466 [Melastoma candidum]|uniref:Uncharacterized protein n=1 Tax=Melastoma candidum TaxID=119954 RepID=A0ACB9QG89_9MYRT|nr:hypothetical protein MLD38_021466 [Melastoma candidum]